jgi:hypothetical protein
MKFMCGILVASAIFCGTLPLFAEEGAKLRYSGSAYNDDNGVAFRQPEGIACSGTVVIVGDTGNNRLVRFVLKEKELTAGREIKVQQLTNPVSVQISSKGDVFALDGKQHRVAQIGVDGSFKGYVGEEGESLRMAVRSFKVARDDSIYLLDVYAGRVVVIGRDGRRQRQIDFPKEYAFFSDLAVDSKGTVFLIDCVKGRLWSAPKGSNAFSPLGAPLSEHLLYPVALTIDARGTVYITDTNGGAIGIVGQDGSFLGKQLGVGWTEGLTRYPAQICVTDGHDLLVADRGNSRVQIFTVAR